MASSQPEIRALECEIAESDCSDHELLPVSVPQSRRARRKIVWKKTAEFETEDEAKNYFADSWSHMRTQVTKLDGRRSVVYYCKLHGRAGCLAQVKYEHYPGGIFVAYASADEHNERLGVRQIGILPSVKAKIAKVVGNGHLPPKLLTNALQSQMTEEEKMPPAAQIRNYVQYKHRSTAKPIVHIRDLKQWCHSRLQATTDDECFVVDQEYNYRKDDLSVGLEESDDDDSVEEKHNRFTIFCSTRRLLLFASYADALHADGTYKLNYAGFPAIVVGVSDKARTFHPIGMALTVSESSIDYAFIFKCVKKGVELLIPSYSQKVLIADNAPAITNGFTDAFGTPEKRINCWAHVDTKVKMRLVGIDKDTKSLILHDIALLQRSPNEEIFNLASLLFLKKWKENRDSNVLSFLDYFKTQWLDENSGWYEGLAVGYPSTNNGLEATNRWVKEHGTFRNKLDLG